MKKIPRISDSEWRVMQVLWSSPGLTADEVADALEGKVTWNACTIRTLINRLLGKKVLRHRKEGRRYRYWPAISWERCVRQERRSFVERVYGGTVTPLLAAFIEETPLSPEEIKELKRMLDDNRTR
ncbi:MAG: BlaI/MecI/CopY family transcriptional regulator [Planctomycetota bacterium]|jgi:BlaI family penicillinase repressor